MITIPTCDLTGILADTLPFVYPDEDFPDMHCLRIEWDGERLHAHATDRYRIAISTWDPTDPPPDDTQDALGTDWGSGDDPWSTFIGVADAKDLVKVFKLPHKEGQTPLTVDYDAQSGRLTVDRSRITGYSAMKVNLATSLEGFPDLRAMLAKNDVVAEVRTVVYTAKFLADFGKVRPRGPLELMFTGDKSLTHVTTGKRFVGAIMPARLGDGE